MKRVLSERTYRKDGFFKRRMDSLIASALKKRRAAHNARRGVPIAVFANDYIGIKVFIDGLYEKEDLADLRVLLESLGLETSTSSAIDIGANIGNHSIEFSRYFKSVLSFEPNPRTFDVLLANTKRLGNVHAFNLGCSSESAKLTLHEDINNFGGSSVKVEVDGQSQVDIEVKPLDELPDLPERVALIKIDVEGMEIDALKGAEQTIKRCYPIICFEQHERDFVEPFQETEVVDWLRERGYKMFAVAMPDAKDGLLDYLKRLYGTSIGRTRRRQVVEFEALPRRRYPMVYAIHSSNHSR